MIRVFRTLADQARGGRLRRLLDAEAVDTLAGFDGLVLYGGRDYQALAVPEQQELLDWCAEPGRVLLLVPPYNTTSESLPKGWRAVSGNSGWQAPKESLTALVACEVQYRIAGALVSPPSGPLQNPDGVQLSLLYRKHPSSGVFGVTCLPIWSLALLEQPSLVKAWLDCWMALAGKPTLPAEVGAEEASDRLTDDDYAVLLFLCSRTVQDEADLLGGMSDSPVFDVDPGRVRASYRTLCRKGMISDGRLADIGVERLQNSPYWAYADALRIGSGRGQ